MMLSLRHRFVFIENPKAGSTSLRQALATRADVMVDDPLSARHQSWLDTLYRQADALRHCRDAFRFGVIREPVDWARSWHAFTCQDEPFEDWWDSPRRFRFQDLHCPSQFSRFTGFGGRCAMHLLIPFETLAEAGPVLSRRLGFPVEPAHLNRNPAPRPPLPDALRARVLDALADDAQLHEKALETWEKTCSG